MADIIQKDLPDKVNDIMKFESISSELEFYKTRCEIMEKDLFKSETKNKKLEAQLKKCIEINSTNGKNMNNSSITYYLPSEFKSLWEKMNQEKIPEALENVWDIFEVVVIIIQETFRLMDSKSKAHLKNIISFILNYLNVPFKDYETDRFLSKLRGIFQENFIAIFSINEDFYDNYLSQLKLSIENSKNSKVQQNKEKIYSDLSNKCFKDYIHTLYRVCMYMNIHDPLLSISIDDDFEKNFCFYSKNDHFVIEGYSKMQVPCIVVLNPPLLRSNYPFQGIKPSVYIIPEPDEHIIELCQKNLELNEKKLKIEPRPENQDEISFRKDNAKDKSFISQKEEYSKDNNIKLEEIIERGKKIMGDTNNFPKKIYDKDRFTPPKKLRINPTNKTKSISSFDMNTKVFETDFQNPKNCFDHPLSKKKAVNAEKCLNNSKERSLLNYRSNSISNFKNCSNESVELLIQSKDMNEEKQIKSARLNHNFNLIINNNLENHNHHGYQTTSNEILNEDKIHDLLLNLSNNNSFAITKDKNFQGDGQFSKGIDFQNFNTGISKKKNSSSIFFTNEKEDSRNSIVNEKANQNKIKKGNNYNEKLNNFFKDKTKFEKDIQANLRRIYSQSNKIKLDSNTSVKFKTLTEKYFNSSPKIKKDYKKQDQNINKEIIKNYYIEYLNKAGNGNNHSNTSTTKLQQNLNIEIASNTESQISYYTPKSINKNFNFDTTTNQVATKVNEKDLKIKKDKEIVQLSSSGTTAFKTVANKFGDDKNNHIIIKNHDLNQKNFKKKIENIYLKSKNFRTRLSHNVEDNLNEKQKSVKPRYTSVKSKFKLIE